VNTQTTEEIAMARVNQRLWKLPGQRTKRKAWGFTAQINGKQVRRYKAEWTQDDAEAELAKTLLQVEPEKPKGPGITLAQAADRYLASKARKRTIEADRRQLDLLKAEFGGKTPLTEITASRISAYKAKRLATVRTIGKGEGVVERRLTAAAVNRPLALLRHLLRLAHEEWGELNAVPKIRTEKEPQGRLRWLTEDEARRLLAACRKSRNAALADLVEFCLFTGLRQGEALGLTWDRVDRSPGRRPAGAHEERSASRGAARLECRRHSGPSMDERRQGVRVRVVQVELVPQRMGGRAGRGRHRELPVP
jgi:integrase